MYIYTYIYTHFSYKTFRNRTKASDMFRITRARRTAKTTSAYSHQKQWEYICKKIQTEV
jgi:hypothetical protein